VTYQLVIQPRTERDIQVAARWVLGQSGSPTTAHLATHIDARRLIVDGKPLQYLHSSGINFRDETPRDILDVA